jgi:hypothetical protein
MLTLKSADRQDLVTYANALDTMFGLPRPNEVGYAAVFGNLAAQADPNAVDAMWALSIATHHPLWDAIDQEDETAYKFPADLAALDPSDPHYLPFPASNSTWDCTYMHDPAEPGWFPSGPPPV